MGDTAKKKSTIGKKIIQLLIFNGVLGWIAFLITITLWITSSKKHAKSIENLHSKNELAKQLDQMVLAQNLELTEKGLQISTQDQKILQIKEALENVKSSHISALNSEITKSELLFLMIRKSLSKPSENETTLDSYATIILQSPSKDTIFNNQFHSFLAEEYFKLDSLDKTKKHLKLSQNFNPEQIQRINKALNLKLAILSVKNAIKNKLPQKQIATNLKKAYTLVDELANDLTKKDQVEQLRSTLLNLETLAVLNSPPQEALAALQRLLNSQKVTAQLETTPLSQRLHFLETSTMAYDLSLSVNRTSDAENYKKMISLASSLVEKLEQDHPQISYSKAVVELRQLDTLFIDGDASVILKSINVLQSHAKKTNGSYPTIFLAAADGHKAAVLYERGEITNAKNLLTTAIGKLKALCVKSPTHNLALFRLGILHWLQAQLTQSDDTSYLHLKYSTEVLDQSSNNADRLQERAIRQFAAMVEGDLGHLNERKGNKKDAKKHFNAALNHWHTIEKNWGKNEETKEGIRYCKWRFDKL